MPNLQGLKLIKLFAPVSAANTAAATSAWIDVREAEGDLMFLLSAGALTGSIVWTIEHATDSGGTGGAAITPDDGAYGTVTAGLGQTKSVNVKHTGGWVRCVGTIVTGPVFIDGWLLYVPKYI